MTAIDLLGPASDNAVTVRPARTITRGASDTYFKNCSSPDAGDGTAFGADFFNDMLAQLRTACRSAGIVLDNADDMLWRAMQSVGLRYAVDTGTAGHLVATYSPIIAAVREGLAVLVKAANDCPGATDFNPNGLGAAAVVWPDGSALATGDFKAGSVLLLVNDGTHWQLIFKLNAGTAAAASFVPGCVYQWPMEAPPTGTLECNGALISRVTYARLFGIVGTTYGAGDGTTTFALPDYRGEFLRGWDHGRGADPDAAARTNRGDGTGGDHVGSKQASAVKASDLGTFSSTDSFVTSSPAALAFTTIGGSGDQTWYTKQVSAAASGSGNETRPRNVNILYVIAY